jgi:DNA-directed RNA polymerase
VKDLAEDIEQLLQTECQSAYRFMLRVQEAVDKVHADGNYDFIFWRTPMGFEVYNREYRYDKKFQRDIYGGEKVGDIDVKIQKPKFLSWADMKDCAPPNLVHSLDATLLHGTLVFGRFWGEKEDGKVYIVSADIGDKQKEKDIIPYPVITVHDAFACHARVCEDLNQKLRDNMVAIYRDLEPLEAFLSQTEGGEFDPIQRGDDWIKTNRQAFG